MIITSHILAEPIFENWKKEIATRKKVQNNMRKEM